MNCTLTVLQVALPFEYGQFLDMHLQQDQKEEGVIQAEQVDYQTGESN